jgi:hypothetical protein
MDHVSGLFLFVKQSGSSGRRDIKTGFVAQDAARTFPSRQSELARFSCQSLFLFQFDLYSARQASAS